MKNCLFANIFASEGGIIVGYRLDFIGEAIRLEGNSLNLMKISAYSEIMKYFIVKYLLAGSLIQCY